MALTPQVCPRDVTLAKIYSDQKFQKRLCDKHSRFEYQITRATKIRKSQNISAFFEVHEKPTNKISP